MTLNGDLQILLFLDGEKADNINILDDFDLLHTLDGTGEDSLIIDGTLSLLDMNEGEFGVFQRVSGADTYTGDYEVIPQAETEVILATRDKVMANDVTVRKVPYYEVSNTKGTTVYIAND